MRLSIEGLNLPYLGPAVLVVAKKPEPGSRATAAEVCLGEVLFREGIQTKGEHIATRALTHLWTRHEVSEVVDYSWMDFLKDLPRFHECLAGGVLIAQEDGKACSIVGAAMNDFSGGVAGSVAAEIKQYLEGLT